MCQWEDEFRIIPSSDPGKCVLVLLTETESIAGAGGLEAEEGTEKTRFRNLLYSPRPAIANTDLSMEGGQPHLGAD